MEQALHTPTPTCLLTVHPVQLFLLPLLPLLIHLTHLPLVRRVSFFYSLSFFLAFPFNARLTRASE